jgi:hypothetical protein
MYDVAGNPAGTIILEHAPASFDALVNDSLFLLNAPGGGLTPAMVLHVTEQPSVLFIPTDLNTL